MADNDFAPDLAVEPRSVDDAREAIEQTRERISATLDQIETRIDETKQDIRRRADVLRPVRERIAASPWSALAIGAGVGLALGLLTGGSDEEEERDGRRRSRAHHHPEAGGRAHHREGEREPASGHEHETAYGRSRVHVHGGEGSRARAGVGGRERASMPERIVDHLFDAIAGAVSDGISTRIRHKIER